MIPREILKNPADRVAHEPLRERMIAPLQDSLIGQCFSWHTRYWLRHAPGQMEIEEALEFLNGPDFIPATSDPAQIEFDGSWHFKFPTPRPCNARSIVGNLFRYSPSALPMDNSIEEAVCPEPPAISRVLPSLSSKRSPFHRYRKAPDRVFHGVDKNKLSAVKMSAESQIEGEQMRQDECKADERLQTDQLSAGAIDGAVESGTTARLPASARRQHHRGTNLVYADPPIAVSSHGAERSDARQSSNQRLQRLRPLVPSTRSPQAGQGPDIPRCDLQQFVNNVAMSILSQMKITRKQEIASRADIRDIFTAHEQRPSRTNLDVIE
jgi:hypothetical protein